MKKIVITGSPKWQDRIVIKEFIFKLKNSVDDLEIISGGLKNGVDAFVKKYTLEFELNYSEIPPFEYQWNQACILDPYRYGKPFKPGNMYIRNDALVKYADILIVYRYKDEESVMLDDLICRFEKKDKNVLIFN